jgi:nucleoside-diphosphate-sugar epimerase
LHPYGASKAAGDALLQAAARHGPAG